MKALGRPFCHDGTFCPEKYQKLTGSVTTRPSMRYCFMSARARATRDWYSVIMSTSVHLRKPAPIFGVAAMDCVEEELLQLARERPGLAVADLAVVGLDHRRDFGAGAAEESLVGDVNRVAREEFLAHREASVARDTDDRVARDALADVGGRRRDE